MSDEHDTSCSRKPAAHTFCDSHNRSSTWPHNSDHVSQQSDPSRETRRVQREASDKLEPQSAGGSVGGADNDQTLPFRAQEEGTHPTNKAAHRKADLQVFVRDSLSVQITGSETISQLQSKAMRAILESTPAVPEDEMGFGEHSSLSYMQVLKDYPKYLQWCRQTMKEESVNWRMERFVKWANAWEHNKTSHRRKGMPAPSDPASSATDTSFSLISQQIPVPESEEEMVTEVDLEVAALESQIQELRRRQARVNKEKSQRTEPQ